jgi:hypothetical protein
LLELCALALGFVGIAPRQHDDEFVSRVSDANVVRTDCRAKDARDLAERTVAHVVAVAVVDALEVVQIHDEQRDFLLQPLRPGQLARRCMNRNRVFGRPVSGSSVSLPSFARRAQVIDDRRGLFRCAVEQAG